MKSVDSLAFILFINEEQIVNRPCTEISLDEVAAGKTNLQALLRNGTEINQTVVLKPNTHVFYELRQIKNNLKIVLSSEVSSTANSTSTAQPSATERAEEPTIIGCLDPVTTSEFDRMKLEVADRKFEEDKMKLMQSLIMNYCFEVSQIKELLAKLDLEDDKLQLLMSTKGHVHDLHHIAELSDVFLLQKNQEKAKNFLRGLTP
jgi:hypothetical protein